MINGSKAAKDVTPWDNDTECNNCTARDHGMKIMAFNLKVVYGLHPYLPFLRHHQRSEKMRVQGRFILQWLCCSFREEIRYTSVITTTSCTT